MVNVYCASSKEHAHSPVFAAAAIADAAAAIDRDLGIGFLRFTFETTVSVIVSA
jgi:hypothetical protein